ncbi:hypothetical protein KFK09_000421 [Dendrobium nobile]|uniref:Uncharacterized protein n=1 Tax=Dendrobium nobile TaxID=94219 RepID=A0A8T3CEN7_DENNO|nr:hypothetical protein KFK09_000421 [Dendrobium nobile]
MQILKDGGIQLKNIVRWKVGSGEQINVLGDIWLLDKILNAWATFVDCISLEGMMVQQLISDEGKWDEGKLKMFFQEELILLIMQVKIDTVVKKDRLETISKLSGRSLSALAYDFVFRDKYMDDDGGFEVENYEHIVVHCKYLNEAFSAIHGWGFALPKFHSLDDCLEEMRRSSAKNKSMVRLYCTEVFLSGKNRNLVKHGRAAMTSSLVHGGNVISLSTLKNNLYLDSWVLISLGSLQQLGTLHR